MRASAELRCVGSDPLLGGKLPARPPRSSGPLPGWPAEGGPHQAGNPARHVGPHQRRRKPPAVQHWRGQRASVPRSPRQSQQHQPPTPESIRAFHQAAQPASSPGDRRAERDQTAQGYNSRVKTSDRVRGAHERPATSLTYPNNCLQQFVHHGHDSGRSARELAMSSASSMKITACSSESNSSKALCSSSAIIASPSAPSFDGRISTNGQPNRPATAFAMTSCQYREGRRATSWSGAQRQTARRGQFEQRCEDPLVDDLSLRSQPEESSHRSGGTSSPPHRWSTDIADGSIDSAFS